MRVNTLYRRQTVTNKYFHVVDAGQVRSRPFCAPVVLSVCVACTIFMCGVDVGAVCSDPPDWSSLDAEAGRAAERTRIRECLETYRTQPAPSRLFSWGHRDKFKRMLQMPQEDFCAFEDARNRMQGEIHVTENPTQATPGGVLVPALVDIQIDDALLADARTLSLQHYDFPPRSSEHTPRQAAEAALAALDKVYPGILLRWKYNRRQRKRNVSKESGRNPATVEGEKTAIKSNTPSLLSTLGWGVYFAEKPLASYRGHAQQGGIAGIRCAPVSGTMMVDITRPDPGVTGSAREALTQKQVFTFPLHQAHDSSHIASATLYNNIRQPVLFEEVAREMRLLVRFEGPAVVSKCAMTYNMCTPIRYGDLSGCSGFYAVREDRYLKKFLDENEPSKRSAGEQYAVLEQSCESERAATQGALQDESDDESEDVSQGAL